MKKIKYSFDFQTNNRRKKIRGTNRDVVSRVSPVEIFCLREIEELNFLIKFLIFL